MRVKIRLILLMILLLCTFTVHAETTQDGLFYTISNACSASVSLLVADDVCALQIDSAVYARLTFSGTMVPGEKKEGMACTGKNGSGLLRLVLSHGTTAPVMVPVKPDEVVTIPKSFCPATTATPERQLLRKK